MDHFFLTSTHNWLLFFTNQGRVYRIKGYEVPEGSRDSKGQHVANLLQLGPDEKIQQVLSIRDYSAAQYLVLATRSGKVKKTHLSEYDSARQGGLIAVRLREIEGAYRTDADGKKVADDQTLRPMGRQTAGVQAMKFRGEPGNDLLLSMDVIPADSDSDLLVVTNEGFAKRTALSEYRLQGRNGYGVKAINLVEDRGSLVGAMVVHEDDQVMAIMKSGKVIRSDVSEIKRTGRNTQGVTLAKTGKDDEILSIARNAEKDDETGDGQNTDS